MATCYRHPDRETGRACTRCGRPACADCLVQAHVGSHCRECVRAAAPPGAQRARRLLDGRSVVAGKAIVALTVGAFAVITLVDGTTRAAGPAAERLALFGPAVADGEWWRLVTNALVHDGIIHLLFNMLVLYQVALVLEPAAGSLRFGLLYLVSVLGGAAGALLLDPNAYTVGASGGVFGVAAAATLALHRQGARFWETAFGPLLLINFAFGFFVPNVSIGGHLGGLVAGLVAAEVMMQARRLRRVGAGLVAVAFVGVAAAALAFGAAGASIAR